MEDLEEKYLILIRMNKRGEPLFAELYTLNEEKKIVKTEAIVLEKLGGSVPRGREEHGYTPPIFGVS